MVRMRTVAAVTFLLATSACGSDSPQTAPSGTWQAKHDVIVNATGDREAAGIDPLMVPAGSDVVEKFGSYTWVFSACQRDAPCSGTIDDERGGERKFIWDGDTLTIREEEFPVRSPCGEDDDTELNDIERGRGSATWSKVKYSESKLTFTWRLTFEVTPCEGGEPLTIIESHDVELVPAN